MQRIIVSDIFGRTPALEEMASSISGTTRIVDPYGAGTKHFTCEEEAYSHFSATAGIHKYARTLSACVRSCDGPVTLIGFSAGASAIWKISGDVSLTNVAGALCFYGSQIRLHPEILPNFPITLVFPEKENHFSVSELIARLGNIPAISIHRSSLLHGFMNQYSENFNQSACEHYVKALADVETGTSVHHISPGSIEKRI